MCAVGWPTVGVALTSWSRLARPVRYNCLSRVPLSAQASPPTAACNYRDGFPPMIRIYAILALLHAYIAWRLLPDLATYPWVALALGAWLVLSLLVMPLGFAARRFRDADAADRATWIGMLAAGAFSSLLVLTLLRDVVPAAANPAPASW